jgi:hypothetical protein
MHWNRISPKARPHSHDPYDLFESAALQEMREAELFYAELMGLPPRRSQTGLRSGEAEGAAEVPGPWRCGFPVPQGNLPEEDLRAAIVAAAQAEWDAWHTGGRPVFETAASVFPRLVCYYLSVISTARPDTLTALWSRAMASTTRYTDLLAAAEGSGAERTAAAALRARLLSGAPGTATPADLNSKVESSLFLAHKANLDHDAWSAVWVSFCVRSAAIGAGVERMSGSRHFGRDVLLQVNAAHRVYTATAAARAAAGTTDTYQAFDPAVRAPQVGDIIVQDRAANHSRDIVSFSSIAAAFRRGHNTHGDIVVEVAGDHVIAIGGNLGLDLEGSVRKRRYPLVNGRLQRARTERFTQEDNAGVLPPLPNRAPPDTPVPPDCDGAANAACLPKYSTERIVTLLSPVPMCV